MKQISGQTGPRTTWRCLLVAPPARGGRRLKNSCVATFISPLPVDLEVRYCRELRQPTQLRQGAPRGIVQRTARVVLYGPKLAIICVASFATVV